jgi:hypothetical protein
MRRFIGEKYNELADPNIGTATLQNEQFNNDICTTLSLYFFTPPSIMTSMLCYYNNVRHEVYTEFNAKEENLIRVPLGVSTFPYDAFPVPKAGAETTTTNLKFFKGMFHLPRLNRDRLTVVQSAISAVTSPAWNVRRRWSVTCESSSQSITRCEEVSSLQWGLEKPRLRDTRSRHVDLLQGMGRGGCG